MKNSNTTLDNINMLLSTSLINSKSDEFINFFKFLSRFNHYSKYNSMLIYIQNKDVAYYGSGGFWKKKFNRNIKEEARPYIILTPFTPVTIVYDIIDTEGEIPIEELLEKGLPFQPFSVLGELNTKQYSKLLGKLKDWGIPLHNKPLSYFHAGYIWTPKGHLEICINTKKSITENFVVIIHELAHLLLGHTGFEKISNNRNKKELKLTNRLGLGRSVEELEAETVAFLIASKYGLTTKSAEYLAGYIRNENDLINFNYETVIHVADKIERMFLS